MKPLKDKVTVREVPAATSTASGIELPAQAQERPLIGTVEGIGSTVRELAVGDKVVYSGYGGTPVTSGDHSVLVIREQDVFAKVVENDG